MMQSLRKVAVAILFGTLIVAFAIGIGARNYFDRQSQATLASVGSSEITVPHYERVYKRTLENYSARAQRRITPAEAQAAGLPARVLQGMIAEAALDEEARKLGLGLSTAGIKENITHNDIFQNAKGDFDTKKYEAFLQRIGYSAIGFEAELKDDLIRRQLRTAFEQSAIVPQTLLDSYNRYLNEQRTLAYIAIDKPVAGNVTAPSANELQSYYDEHKLQFMAPEYRKLVVASITPDAVKTRYNPSDVDLHSIYDATAKNFGTPERRKIEAIPFQTKQAADKASTEIASGKEFLEIAKDAGFKQPEIDAGIVSKNDLKQQPYANDQITDTIFSLDKGKISQPLDGPLSTVIIRVLEILPAEEKSFEDVKDQVRSSAINKHAVEDISKLTKSFEDDRTTGISVTESAKKLGLPLVDVTLDRSGKGMDGKAIEIAGVSANALAEAAFKSDVGVDNEALRLGGNGFAFYDVSQIIKTRQKTFDEVKNEAEKDWINAQIRLKLTAKGKEFVERIDKGEAIADLAKGLNIELKTSKSLKRNDNEQGLPASANSQAFALEINKASSISIGDGTSRAVFQLVKITPAPPLDEKSSDAIRAKLSETISQDSLIAYLDGIKKRAGTTIDSKAIADLAGGLPGGDYDE